MLHPAAEIHIRQSLQLVHQLLALAVRDVLGEQQTVNEQPQFAIGEVPLQIEVRPQVALLRLAGFGVRHHANGFAVLDVVAAVHEVQNVPPDGFAVGGHIVFGFQNLGDVLLTQAMFLVGILPQDIQNVQNQQLFRLFHRHGITSSSIIFYHGISYNTRWRGAKTGHRIPEQAHMVLIREGSTLRTHGDLLAKPAGLFFAGRQLIRIGMIR